MQNKTNNNNDKGTLKSLEEIFDKDKLVRCPNCQSATFLDWGMQILETAAQIPGKRFEGIAQPVGVKICTDCQLPVVHYGGDLYDASDFVTAKAIQQLIQHETTTTKTPVKAGY